MWPKGSPFGTERHRTFASNFLHRRAFINQRAAFGSDVLIYNPDPTFRIITEAQLWAETWRGSAGYGFHDLGSIQRPQGTNAADRHRCRPVRRIGSDASDKPRTRAIAAIDAGQRLAAGKAGPPRSIPHPWLRPERPPAAWIAPPVNGKWGCWARRSTSASAWHGGRSTVSCDGTAVWGRSARPWPAGPPCH